MRSAVNTTWLAPRIDNPSRRISSGPFTPHFPAGRLGEGEQLCVLGRELIFDYRSGLVKETDDRVDPDLVPGVVIQDLLEVTVTLVPSTATDTGTSGVTVTCSGLISASGWLPFSSKRWPG
jgi:hypothetical protein